MIRHIVLFEFSSDEIDSSLAELKGILEPLAAEVPGVLSLRVDGDKYRDSGHWDAALVSEYESWESLRAYQSHPLHQGAVLRVDEIVSHKAVVDYEL